MAVDSSKRIAIVAASAPPYGAGGVASAHYNLFRAMQGRGLKVKLFTFFDNGIPQGEQDGIVRHGLDPRLVKYIFMLAVLPFRLLFRGRVATETATILRSYWGARKMTKSIRRYAPDVVLLSDHGAPGLAFKKAPGQRIVLVSHHNPLRFAEEPLIGDYAKSDARLALRLEKRVLAKVDQVICPSNYMADYFQRSYEFSGPITVIPNLLDRDLLEGIPALDIHGQLGLPPDTPVVYMPAAGSRIKGAAFLPEILAGLDAAADQTLGVYIPGYMPEELRGQLVEGYPNLKIHAPGQVEYNRHIGLVKSCRFGISPAVMENFSMAILEAAMCGVPMLAFDRGGNGDILENNQNGYLVPAFDIKALIAKSIEWLKSKQFEDRKQQARDYTAEHFCDSQVLQDYLDVLGV